MKQLYDLGVRGFWFTDAQFIPAKKHIEDAKVLLQAIKDQVGTIFIGLHTSEPIILMLILLSLWWIQV